MRERESIDEVAALCRRDPSRVRARSIAKDIGKSGGSQASRSEDTGNEKETEGDEQQEDRRGKARHNESRLRRQAERGRRSGPVHIAFASAISPRSSLVPRARAIVWTYVRTSRTP